MPTFAPAFETSEHWRDGRVVDYSSLENYRAERHRGFESLSLRKEFSNAELFFDCQLPLLLRLSILFCYFKQLSIGIV